MSLPNIMEGSCLIYDGGQDDEGVAGVFYGDFKGMMKFSLVMNWRNLGWEDLGVCGLHLWIGRGI